MPGRGCNFYHETKEASVKVKRSNLIWVNGLNSNLRVDINLLQTRSSEELSALWATTSYFHIPSSFILFSFDFLINFSVVFGFLSLFVCVFIYFRCLICGYHEVLLYQSIYKQNLSGSSFIFKCISNMLHLYYLLKFAGFDIIFVCGWFPIFTVCLPFLVSFSIHNFIVSHCGLLFST